jgi:hypothetical protein
LAVALEEHEQQGVPVFVHPEALHEYVKLSSPQALCPQTTVTGPASLAVALAEQLHAAPSAPHVCPV